MNKEKQVDESWKEQVSGERSTDTRQPSESQNTAKEQETPETPEITFLNYITSLGFQAMVFLGEIENPITNKKEKNLQQAKFLIDTLGLLKEKTEGNLDDQENNMLNASLYELQLKYVEVSNQQAPGSAGNA